MNASKVRRQILLCQRCFLHKRVTSPVPFEGKINASLLIVGEAPGGVEDIRGRPFIGPSGKVLRSALREAGFDIKDIMFINTVSCNPGGTPTNKSILACRVNLKAQYQLSKAPFVLLLGNVALQSFRPGETIGKVRGQHWKKGRRTFFATWHPAYVLRNANAEPQFYGDLRRLRVIMDGSK